jgi:hypothetical protein
MFFDKLFKYKKKTELLKEWNVLIKYSSVKHGRVKIHKDWNLILTIPFCKKNSVNFKQQLLLKWEVLLKKYLKQKQLSWNKNNLLFWNEINKNIYDIEWYLKQQLYLETEKYVIKYTKILNKTYNKISIKKMSSRWGSCSTNGNISINLKLINFPLKYLEYVVVHEVCHLVQPNHSVHFWNEVVKLYPNYKTIRKEMKKNIL